MAAAVKDPAANPISKCRSWLGPSQPGITTPDPTASAPRAGLRKPAAAAPLPGPSAGAPAATPAPSSAPVPAPAGGGSGGGAPAGGLPPLDQLVGNVVNSLPNLPGTLNSLLGGGAPPGQRSSTRSEKQLLDYLLAP